MTPFILARLFIYKNQRLGYLVCLAIGGWMLELGFLLTEDTLGAGLNSIMAVIDTFTLIKETRGRLRPV